MSDWLKYSYRTALLAGIGALFSVNLGVTNASASVMRDDSLSRDDVDGSVLLKQENGSWLISERGGPFEPLDLGDTPEAKEFETLFGQLSPDRSAVHIPVDRRIVADGGVGVAKAQPTKSQDKPPSKRR